MPRLRSYDSEKDFDMVRQWVTDECTHAMWCANRFCYPIKKENFDQVLSDIAAKNGDLPFIALTDNGIPAGFFCYSLNRETNEGMLKFVIVDPKLRGKGFGTEMIRSAVRHAFDNTHADAVQLSVFPENIRAKRCYEKAGFKERRTEPLAFRFQTEYWGRCNMIIRNEEFQD